jgi:hypothetical protein
LFDSGGRGRGKKTAKKGSTSKRARVDSDMSADDYIYDPADDSDSQNESSAARFHVDDVEEEGTQFDEEIDVSLYNVPQRKWTQHAYFTERSPYQYIGDRTASLPFFHSKVQEDTFFGHLLHKKFHQQQTLDFNYMLVQPSMCDLVATFHVLGLKNFFEHRCNWNDNVIRQFYATVEVKKPEQTIEWMTGQRKYTATFREFAAANMLDYDFLTAADSHNIVDEEELDDSYKRRFYEPARLGIRTHVGKVTSLRHHPAILNKIARVTIMPKSGNREVIRHKYWNLISHIMYREKINVILLILEQMADMKTDFDANIPFAPYIMSLINAKTRFVGNTSSKHTAFRPFINDTYFLQREVTPFPDPDNAQDEPVGDAPENVEPQVNVDAQAMPPPPPPMQPQWMPPAGYFDPYFATMQQGLGTQFGQQLESGFQNMQQHFQGQLNTMQQQFHGYVEAGFQTFGQHVHNTMYQPIMTRLENVKSEPSGARRLIIRSDSLIVTQQVKKEFQARDSELA